MSFIFLSLCALPFLVIILGLINPRLVIWWGKKKSRFHIFLIYSLSMPILLILGGITACNSEGEKNIQQESIVQSSQSSEEDEVIRADSSNVMRHTIFKKEDYSYANTPRMAYRIILDVEKLPTKSQLEKTADDIWKNGNRNWQEFTVFAYMPEMDTGNVAFYVAEYRQTGRIRSEVQMYSLYGTKWQPQDEQTESTPKAKSAGTSQQIQEYYINLEVTKLAERKIKIDVSTNFPDGTNFMVNVQRIYKEKGGGEDYAGEIFYEDIAVKAGKIEVETVINDSKWYNKYYQDSKELGHLVEYPGIGQISPNVEVSVLFSPRRNQSEQVLKILGKDGEFVTGSGADKRGFTTFRIEKPVAIPFEK